MIHKNWHELIKPSGLNLVNDEQNPNSATIVVEPLERGFGLTLGMLLEERFFPLFKELQSLQ